MEEGADPRLLTDDAALVDVGALEVIHATGADRVAFLHRLLTGDVAGTAAGGGGRSLLLTLKGQVAADIHLFVRAEEVRMVVAPGEGEPTAAALNKYAVMDDFVATVDPAATVLALHGPRSLERLAAAGVAADLPERRWGHVDAAGPDGAALWVVRAQALGAEGVWVFAPASAREALEARLAAAGVRRLDRQVAEVLRIRAGEPTWGAEIGADYFPMEVGLDGAIDYAKGCYLGQEPIVRIRDRGHINWRLVGLRLRGEVVPVKGDTLESDPKPRAGRVTSAARLPGEPPVALALLHVSVPVGSEIRVRHGEDVLPALVVEAGST